MIEEFEKRLDMGYYSVEWYVHCGKGKAFDTQ